MKTNLTPAPIDNKNVMEEFADLFHHDSYMEHRERHTRHQAFWCEGVLVVLSYEYGNNWFSFKINTGNQADIDKVQAHIRKGICEITGQLIVRHVGNNKYRFYHNPDWEHWTLTKNK